MKLYLCFPEGKAKVLTMSYDDGKWADERLVELFNRYGIRGTFNLNYGMMECPERIDRERIRTLYAGHEVASHTMTHPTIARCPLTEVAREILEDRRGLESLVGYPVRGHAYPNGSCSEEIKDLLRGLGIAYGRTVQWESGSMELPGDLMEWNATCHHNYNLMKYAKEFAESQKKQYLQCLYVWGHSYEFERDGNWELMEEFCSYMGGREDVWYATNIEIADYLDAGKRLQYGAAGDFVYNPSAQTVWISVDDVPLAVEGGSLVRF